MAVIKTTAKGNNETTRVLTGIYGVALKQR